MQPVCGASGRLVARPLGRTSRPLVHIVTAVVLVAFVLRGLVPVGRATNQTRPLAADPRPATDPGRAEAEKAGVDIDAVVDNVRHRVTPAEDGSGALAAHDDRYRARFDASGFGFTLGEDSSRFGVSLRGVQQGTRDLALSPVAWSPEANVAVRGLGSGMTERVTARAGELEWDVVLTHPLVGRGDLRLEAELRGLDGVPARVTDPPAWRFPLSEGGAARMGEVVVKDATGAELHRALPQVRGEVLRLVVPASVLAGARYPLTIDPTVGPELPVGDPVTSSASNSQLAPAVTWNGTDFLVVWQDFRSGTNYDIYAARVSGAGSVLDPAGIPVAAAANLQFAPAVAANGTDFLVVWQDSRSGPVDDVYAARVSGAGTVLEPAGIPISTAANGQQAPSVAWNGSAFLVVWQDSRSGPSDIYGARVTSAGNVLDAAGIAISTAANDQTAPAVAWNGADFLVVWTDDRSGPSDIYGARVSGAGSVLDPAGIAISTAANGQTAPAVASNATDFLVVWQDSRSGTSYDIYGARVSGAGSVLDPAGIPIRTTAGYQIAPAVAWNGTDFLVVWQDYRSDPCCGSYDIYGARVSGAGSVLDPAGLAISTAANDQRAPAVAWKGTDFLVVWQDLRSDADSDIYGAHVSSAGSVLDSAGIPVSTAANDQRAPAVAWNGTDFLVVWQDRRSGNTYDIYGTRVSGAGGVLDPAGIPLSTAADDQPAPAVAWNGTNFFVAWQDSRAGSTDIYGAGVSAGGTVAQPAGIPISTIAAYAESAPAVAWNGSDFLVVWHDFRSASFWDIYGARVSGAGSVLDPAGIPVSTAANDQTAPAVAWNGTEFLVVWTDNRSGPTSFDIYGARVSGAGSVLDPAGIAISTAANNQTLPAVASWGDSFLVVWQDRRSGSYNIYGAGVSADGTVAQPSGIPISTAAGDQTAPELAVRYHFLVAWRDRRAGSNDDVYATRVSPSGVVEEPAGVLVAGSAIDESAPYVTGGPGTTWKVAYSRFVSESPYNATRVFLRTVSPK
jgi:hypothetical protein